MAEENSNPVSPISAAEPPKMSPLVKPAVAGAKTIKLNPVIRKPTVGAAAAIKPIAKPAAAPAPAAPAAVKPILRPAIHKPGEGPAASSLPKPIVKPVAAPAPAAPAPAAAAPEAPAAAKPMEQLKSVTQKLKGITQEIPQQAILRKTGIIADSASEAEKQAAKSKTARIALADAIGAAPVKNEQPATMKTIRIKRPVDIPAAAAAPAEAPAAGEDSATITQRKTLKVARPGSTVRPTGKFGIKRPEAAAPAATEPTAEIADIPEMPAPLPTPVAKKGADTPAWVETLSTVIQAVACLAMAALAWSLFQALS